VASLWRLIWTVDGFLAGVAAKGFVMYLQKLFPSPLPLP